jgi:DNA polymerase
MDNPEAFEELIKERQACKKCHELNNLCHFEDIIKDSPNLLGPWNPLEKNCFDAEILIIGQDFGIFQYLEEAKNMDDLKLKEKGNSTNKKLIKYLKLAGLTDRKIYFTNAVLCIKNGITKKTKSGKSMSSDVKVEWFKNCSVDFLKPLITDHLPNLKIIITLGKYALFSIEQIVESPINTTEPLIDSIAILQHIYISNKHYSLIPMLHPSFDHLSVMKQKEGKKAIRLWEDSKKIIDNL